MQPSRKKWTMDRKHLYDENYKTVIREIKNDT